MKQKQFELIREVPGSACGTCLKCDATLSVYLPRNQPALELLEWSFANHYAEKHGEPETETETAASSVMQACG